MASFSALEELILQRRSEPTRIGQNVRVTTVVAYPDWRDPSWPWIAKLDRARHHIDALASELTAFQAAAYSVTEEPGENPRDIDLVLHVSEPIPMRFSTMVGDAIHNMRSSLDTLAYELARRHVGGVLGPERERLPAFPIFLHKVRTDGKNGSDHFFTRLADLYGPAEREALECVMPGHIWDGLPPDQAESIIGPREEDVKDDQLWLLDNLWNIDKHRRLHFTVWWPEMISWTTGPGDQNNYNWRPGHPPYVAAPCLARW
jgi:hypothetical protein